MIRNFKSRLKRIYFRICVSLCVCVCVVCERYSCICKVSIFITFYQLVLCLFCRDILSCPSELLTALIIVFSSTLTFSTNYYQALSALICPVIHINLLSVLAKLQYLLTDLQENGSYPFIFFFQYLLIDLQENRSCPFIFFLSVFTHLFARKWVLSIHFFLSVFTHWLARK